MVDHIKAQLAAQGASLTPKRTSGRGTADKPADAKKSTKKEPLPESADPQIQQARRKVVGYGRREDTNTTFGCPLYIRTYRVLHQAEADQLDQTFAAILTESNPR